jgi:hypothetical protein
MRATTKWANEQKALLTKIAGLNTTAQNKFLILQAAQYRTIYALQTFNGPFATDVFAEVNTAQQHCLETITGIKWDSPDLILRIQSPIEEGGMGLLPLDALHADIHDESMKLAAAFLAKYNLSSTRFTDDDRESTLRQRWRDWFRCSMVGTNVTQLSLSPYAFLRASTTRSWLLMWPSSVHLEIEDNVWRFNVALRLGQISPGGSKCTDTNVQALSPPAFTKHFLTCRKCGPNHFNLRHKAVQDAMGRVLRFYNVTKKVEPKIPVPGNKRGGSDLLVLTTKTYSVEYNVYSPYVR